MLTHRRGRRGPLVLSLVLVLVPSALGIWVVPLPVPLTRILPNLERAVTERPEDAAAHFVLGRVHGFAFATASLRVAVQPKDGIPYESIESWMQAQDPIVVESVEGPWGQRRLKDEPPIDEPQRARHLDLALRHLRRAVELDPSRPEHHLGLAYVLDVGAESCHLVDSVAAPGLDPEALEPAPHGQASVDYRLRQLGYATPADRNLAWRELQKRDDDVVELLDARRDDADPALRAAARSLLADRWREHAAAAYLRAFELAKAIEPVGDDLPEQDGFPGDLRAQFMSYEAAEAWLRLRERQPPAHAQEREQRAAMAAFLEHVESAPPPSFVTPLVLSLEAHAVDELDALLDPGRTVAFDLDGDRLVERRPWLAPGTALLCWDPEGTGAITSGRQLFGNATWWLLFRDGYQALDALDDDRDGWVAGAELAGLALWFDDDQDAVSDPGEVVRLGTVGIAALATRATTAVGRHPAAERGVRLTDGRLLPTWDWVAPPANATPSP